MVGCPPPPVQGILRNCGLSLMINKQTNKQTNQQTKNRKKQVVSSVMHTGWQDIPAECSQKVPEETINLSLSCSYPRGSWGGGRGGGQEPPSHPRWGPTTRVWGHLVLGQLGLGDNDGSAFIPGQLGIRYVQVNSSAGPFSTSTVRSCPATCFTVYVHREGPYTAGTAGWECRG